MPSTNPGSMHVTTYTLPNNLFELQHDEFYNFVERHCGSIQAKLLEVQLISDACTFIECTDPTEILQYNGEKLKDLKQKACLTTHDGTCIVLPGITASFQTLKKRLLKKLEEDAKKAKRKTSQSSTPFNTPVVNHTKSTDELCIQLIKTIDQWFNKHQIDLNLKNGSRLEENVDYRIEYKDSSTGNNSATIVCSCGCKSTLSRAPNNGHFQVGIF